MVTKTKDAVRRGAGEGVRVVTEGAAHALLRRAPASELSPDEEKVMRMRLGASPPRTAPLERIAEGLTDLEIEVYAAEIEAYWKWKTREASPPARERPRTAPPLPSRTKEKIVRALRRKT